jgi:hypothetical protein
VVDSQAEQIETSSTLTFATRPYNMSVSELSVGPNTFYLLSTVSKFHFNNHNHNHNDDDDVDDG